MGKTAAIFRKEFGVYFSSPIAYVFSVVFVVVMSWLFFKTFFLFGQATMRQYFVYMPYIFLFFVPAITMRLWAEEKKQGTIELLLTLPLKDWEVTLGKYLAALLFLAINLALSIPIVVTVAIVGHPDFGVILAQYLGALLLGAAYLAIGMCISTLTENQIVAFIMSVAFTFVLAIIGENIVTLFLGSQIFARILQEASLTYHFASIGRGVIDSSDIIYYLSVIFFFLYLTVRSIESRKYA